MKAKKWDPKKRVYNDYEIPDDWNCKTYSDDMGEVINCAQCGKKITFGEGYCSRQIHTKMGFGYSVCEDCYERETQEERGAHDD